jgi:hypothetical protein
MMARLDFDIKPGEVWIVEDNNTSWFYMSLEDYEKSLNKPQPDETQEKLDAIGEGLGYVITDPNDLSAKIDALGEAITYLLQEVTQ